MTNPTSSNLTAPLPGDNLPAVPPPAATSLKTKKGFSFRRVFRNRSTFIGGMIVALAVFLAACLVLLPAYGNLGLWLAMHSFFAARGIYYWAALQTGRARLFA